MARGACSIRAASRVFLPRGRPPALAALAVAAACWLGGPPAAASLFGVLVESPTSKRVVLIDPTSGAATASWAGFPVGAFSTGAGALATSGRYLYFSADAPGEESRRLFCVDLTTGALVSSPLISGAAGPRLQTTPAVLVAAGAAVYGLFTFTPGSVAPCAIDPASGALTPLGGEIPTSGYAGGVAAYCRPTGVLHFVARDAGGAGPRLFGVRLSDGALESQPLITPPAGYDAEPALLEADGAGRLLALFRLPGAGWMTLATVHPDTGVASALGPGFAAEGYSSGVADYAWGGQRLYIAANAPGESLRRIYTVDSLTGALVANPPVTSADGFLTVPLLLAADSAATSAPGSVPDGGPVDGTPLRVTRSGTSLTFTWGPSCTGAATDYTLHTGTLGSYYSHTRTQCSTGGALTTTAAQGVGNRYYLVVPVTATQEGSYGTRSSGAQRPPSTTPCKATQNTSPCP